MGNVRQISQPLPCNQVDSMVFDAQGAKAAQKRERNAHKNEPKGAKSQSKVNEAAKSIVCSVCRQAFVSCHVWLSICNPMY